MTVVLVLLSVLAGCGTGSSQDAPTQLRLDGSTFIVTGVTEDGAPHSLVTGSQVRIGFAKGQVTLSAGCNTMSGSYTLSGSRLTVESLAMTEMGCERRLMEQDSWLAGLFERPVQFNAGADAAIISGTTVLDLADRESVSPDLPLAGTRWTLTTLVSGDAASSVAVSPTLVLTGDTAVIDAGCGDWKFRVAISGQRVTWTRIDVQPLPCDGLTREWSRVDQVVGDVLDGPTTVEITEASLRISNGAMGLGFEGTAQGVHG